MSKYETYKNENNKYDVLKVYIIHDNIYFNLKNASEVQDGKDYISEEYLLVKPCEEIEEGTQCYYARYRSFESAYEDAQAENEYEGLL